MADFDRSEFHESLLQMNEISSGLLSLIVGHRQQLLDAGFSEMAAEQMTTVYHGYLLTVILQGAARS